MSMQGIEQQVECATCTWNKLCVEPPTMTKEEVDAKCRPPDLSEVEREKAESTVMGGLMNALFFSGKDRECPACPVFIERLRESPDLTTHIKDFMKRK